jgi:hypothetical protein
MAACLPFRLMRFLGSSSVSLMFYHPAQVKAVTRGTAKPSPNPVYASDTKRISHFLIENCAVRYIPA